MSEAEALCLTRNVILRLDIGFQTSAASPAFLTSLYDSKKCRNASSGFNQDYHDAPL